MINDPSNKPLFDNTGSRFSQKISEKISNLRSTNVNKLLSDIDTEINKLSDLMKSYIKLDPHDGDSKLSTLYGPKISKGLIDIIGVYHETVPSTNKNEINRDSNKNENDQVLKKETYIIDNSNPDKPSSSLTIHKLGDKLLKSKIKSDGKLINLIDKSITKLSNLLSNYKMIQYKSETLVDLDTIGKLQKKIKEVSNLISYPYEEYTLYTSDLINNPDKGQFSENAKTKLEYINSILNNNTDNSSSDDTDIVSGSDDDNDDDVFFDTNSGSEELSTIFKSFIDHFKNDEELLALLKTLAQSGVDLDSDITSINNNNDLVEITLKNPIKLTGNLKTSVGYGYMSKEINPEFIVNIGKTIKLNINNNKITFITPINLAVRIGSVNLKEITVDSSKTSDIKINYSVSSAVGTVTGSFIKSEIKNLSIKNKDIMNND